MDSAGIRAYGRLSLALSEYRLFDGMIEMSVTAGELASSSTMIK